MDLNNSDHNNIHIKSIIGELNNGYLPKSVRKKLLSIIPLFNGIFKGNETIEEMEKNKLSIFRILMTDGHINKYIMNVIGLSDDKISNLEQKLKDAEFIDEESIFKSLREYFLESYKTIDLTVYKHCEKRNVLSYFSGCQDQISNISLSEKKENQMFFNEISAFNSKKDLEFFYNLPENVDNFLGGLGSIKLQVKEEIYVLSFNIKNTLNDVNKNILIHELLQVRKLFLKHGLIGKLEGKIKYVHAKYYDPLTELYSITLLKALPKRKKYSVLYLDGDNFKGINDNYGHKSGDIVLKELASILKSCVRSSEKVIRKGGDEFIILVPSDSKEDLDIIENRIHEKLNTTLIKITDLDGTIKKLKIGVSVGRAYINTDHNIEETIYLADLNMNDNKQIKKCIRGECPDVFSANDGTYGVILDNKLTEDTLSS